MTKNNFINIRLNSYASFDDAMDMCELLSRETGEEYTVMPDNHLGFTTNRVQSNIKRSQKITKLGEEDKQREFCQAWRGFLTNYFQIMFGGLLIINPYKILGWIFYWLHIESVPDWLDLNGFGELLGFGGVFHCFIRNRLDSAG